MGKNLWDLGLCSDERHKDPVSALTSRSQDSPRQRPTRDGVPRILLLAYVDEGAVKSGEQAAPDCKVTWWLQTGSVS